MPSVTTGGGASSGVGAGYWLVKQGNGNIGIVLGPSKVPGVSSYFLGRDLTSASVSLSRGLQLFGATGTQSAGLIQAFDAGALLQGVTSVFVPPNQAPGTTDTSLGQRPSTSEAVPAGINLGVPNVLSDIWTWLTTASNWVRILEYIGGALLIFWGVRQLAEAT